MQPKYTLADLNRDFPNDDACLEWLKNLRWPNGITCRKCGQIRKHHRVAKRLCYACDSCGTHVYPQAGTILQDSRTPLVYWFRAIFLMATTRMGIASKHLEREIGCGYKTAWRMNRMIRKLMNEDILEMLGQVEIDESYFGGRAKNRHIDHRTGEHPNPPKTAVLGILQRAGNVVAAVIPETSREHILPRIKKFVTPRSMVFTDEAKVYRNLPQMGYGHQRVYHSANIYVEGEAHTNSVESFWSIAKNGIRGSNRHVGSRYLQGYLNAYAFRWNHRRDGVSMFRAIVSRLPSSRPTPTKEPASETLPRNPLS
jgi:transposase-like protein